MLSTERLARLTFDARNSQKDVFREVDIRARQRMSQDRELSYGDAVRSVFIDDPELHRAYLDDTPPMRANTED